MQKDKLTKIEKSQLYYAYMVAPNDIHYDLLEEPKQEIYIDAANSLVEKGLLKDTGGSYEGDYSFRITKKGIKFYKSNLFSKAKYKEKVRV